jgi:hypothetical protein
MHVCNVSFPAQCTSDCKLRCMILGPESTRVASQRRTQLLVGAMLAGSGTFARTDIV